MNSEHWKERKDLAKEIGNPLGTTESLYNACRAFVKMYDKVLANEEALNIKNNKDLINYYYVTVSNVIPDLPLLRDKNRDAAVCKALITDIMAVYGTESSQACINIIKRLINKLSAIYLEIGCDSKYLSSFSSAFHKTKDGSIGYTVRTLIELDEKDKEDRDARIMESDSERIEREAEARGECIGMFDYS